MVVLICRYKAVHELSVFAIRLTGNPPRYDWDL